MDERMEPTTPPSEPSQHIDAARTARPPFQRVTHHITQDPIDDVEPEYVTRDRYETLEQASSHRRHMGTVGESPDYLASLAGNEGRGQRRLHYERYLETPKPGKSIFTSHRARKQRRAHFIILLIALLAVILALVWYFILR